MSTTPTRAVIADSQNVNTNQGLKTVVLVNSDGTPASTIKKQAAQADSTATDVTGLKADFNALLAKLRTAGVIASS